MTLLWIGLFLVSIAAVIKAADWFLGAAERIGTYLKMPPFVMGVVLVGLGTSLPELATSLAAVLSGETQIVLGNIVGSNVANVLVIIGLSTVLMGTIRFRKELIDIDIPLLVATTVLGVMVLVDGTLTRAESALLLVGCVGYVLYSLLHQERAEYHRGFVALARAVVRSQPVQNENTTARRPGWRVWAGMLGSMAVLAVASKLAVDSLLHIVAAIGVGVGVVSFFALAIGTSLPELVVSLKALRKGQGDLVVGNIIGSNMFNLLLIAGVSGLILPQTMSLPSGTWMLAGMMIAAGLLGFSCITKRLQIWDGVLFLLIYVALAMQLL